MVYSVSEKTTRELTGEMSELWRGTGLRRNTVLRTNLLTDTNVNTKKFFLASSKREPSLCNPWGSRYITRTGRGSIQMCCFLAPHALFLLPWMPFPYIIHLTNYDSTFRVQLMDPSSAKPFLTLNSPQNGRNLLPASTFTTVLINHYDPMKQVRRLRFREVTSPGSHS